MLLGQIATGNLKLELGSGAVTVEVTGQGALLQTEDANISSNFDTNQIQNVPNPGGDITYVAQTAPGITMNNSTGGGYGNFSAFGLPGTSNLFTINGNDYNDAFLNLNNSGSSNLLLGGNELQEVAVVSNAYTGQYGRQAGAQVDYSTKSGGNAFHGDAVYNWTGRELTANDPINKFGGGTRPFENNNQWAAGMGGPIKKDKAFFFVNNGGYSLHFRFDSPSHGTHSGFRKLRSGQRRSSGSGCRVVLHERCLTCIMQHRESPTRPRMPVAVPGLQPLPQGQGTLAPRVGFNRSLAAIKNGW